MSDAPGPTADAKAGGTLFLLTGNTGWTDVDPQRVYTPEDQAFFGATIYRSLVTYAYSADFIEGTTPVPDLATDLGTPSDGGRTWTFTLRDGITWEDGAPVTCADVAYGVSRAFAIDVTGGGPKWVVRYLDIPVEVDGVSAYPGPYTATDEQQQLFDRAVECDRNVVTFHLNQPIADFNEATTLGMSPVPHPNDHPAADIGEGYGVTSQAWSTGPYRVARYEPGRGGTMELVRNEHWNRDSDPIRKAYPDRWVVRFGLDDKTIDQLLMASDGDDRFALQYGQVQPENLPTIFTETGSPQARFEGRAINGFDPFTRFFWVNVDKVPNENIRRAMSVALDREAIRTMFGGYYGGPGYGGLYGDDADGLIKPSIGRDYAGTGFYTDLFGEAIPPSGNVELARRLIADSGVEAPTLTWNYADTDIGQQYFAIVRESLQAAGFTVEPGPIVPADGCICPPQYDGDFGNSGWGFDWANASTVMQPTFVDGVVSGVPKPADEGFTARVEDALTTADRADQARQWQALNREAVQKAYVIPTFFGRSQTLAGTKVAPIYRWPAYSSWPYGVMYVKE